MSIKPMTYLSLTSDMHSACGLGQAAAAALLDGDHNLYRNLEIAGRNYQRITEDRAILDDIKKVDDHNATVTENVESSEPDWWPGDNVLRYYRYSAQERQAAEQLREILEIMEVDLRDARDQVLARRKEIISQMNTEEAIL